MGDHPSGQSVEHLLPGGLEGLPPGRREGGLLDLVVLPELVPGGIESTLECIKNLEPGGRVALIAPNPEPLNLPLRYLMIRSLEFTSVTGRFAMDIAELLQLVASGVIDTRHITTRYFPLSAVNEALDYINERGDNDPLWPIYAAD